jgi:hypothetical protein
MFLEKNLGKRNDLVGDCGVAADARRRPARRRSLTRVRIEIIRTRTLPILNVLNLGYRPEKASD